MLYSVLNNPLGSTLLQIRSSHQRCSIKKLFLACNFIKKRLQHSCFLQKFSKFLRTPFFKNICECLLLIDLNKQVLLCIRGTIVLIQERAYVTILENDNPGGYIEFESTERIVLKVKLVYYCFLSSNQNETITHMKIMYDNV